MIRLANVLLASTDGAGSTALADSLRRAGYGVTITTLDSALSRAEVDRPDLVILADEGRGESLPDLGRVFKAAAATGDIPVTIAVAAVTPQVCTAALEAGLDDVIGTDAPEAELLARIRPLGRLSTMHDELRRRARTAGTFGVTARGRVSAARQEGRPLVLVAGEDRQAVRPLAGDADLAFADTLFEAEDMLSRRDFDAAIVASRTPGEAEFGFCTRVRFNPSLFNLPIVLVAEDESAIVAAYRNGASRFLGRTADAAVLRAAVLTLVQRQRLRWAIRDALADSLTETTRDAETGFHSAAFLERYLAERITAAATNKRHLSLIRVRVTNAEAVREQFGGDAMASLVRQAGQWIAGLVRVEDLVARTGEAAFCVALPDTPLAEAEMVVQRIAGVLDYTDFAVSDVYQPLKVWAAISVTEVRQGDDLAAIQARIRGNMG